MILPSDFLSEMQTIFNKSDYNLFLKCYDKPYFKGLRVNSLKINPKKFKKIFEYKLKPSPFYENGFYIDKNVEKLGKHPLHHAGAFYLQEPSASFAVTVLDPKPYDKVLDLCAAPGGKTTQIAEKINGTGLVWANEFIKSRTSSLISNIERLGVRNAVVSSCQTDILCKKLAGYFDKVLVDAPCSGEGMFRKNPKAILEWSKEHVKSCSTRQLEILENAKYALKKDGILVYSTCTFSIEENEGVISKFLERNKNFELCEIKTNLARPAICNSQFKNFNLNFAKRITPLENGEGHFVAKLQKKFLSDEDLNFKKVQPCNYKKESKSIFIAQKLYSDLFNSSLYGSLEKFGDYYFILPENLPDLKSLNVLRAGILLCEDKQNCIIPCHAAFMAAKYEEINQKLNFDTNSKEILSFLKGEELEIDSDLKGFTAVCVNNITVGFGKVTNGKLKNKYPKGLRNN